MGYNLENAQNTMAIPYGIHVARGSFPSLSSIDKFGYLETATSSYRTVWDGDSVYSYLSSAQLLTATSSAGASDSGVEITIQGLTTDYVLVSDTITLNASGVATTTETFLRVFRAFVSNGNEVTGDVDITYDGTTYAIIKTEFQQTMMAVYTIPASHSGYLVSANISVEKDQPVVAKLMIRQSGGVLRAQGLVTSFGVPFQRVWQIPNRLPAGTDIEIRAKAGATTSIAAGFELLLED